MQRRYSDCAGDTKSFYNPFGVHAASYTFKYCDSALHVFDHTVWIINSFDSHCNDQIFPGQVFHIYIDLDAGDMAKAGNLISTFQHTVEDRTLLHMDAVHAFFK